VAVFVTIAAAIALYTLGVVLQVMTHELYLAYGHGENKLPTGSDEFFRHFGYRPTEYLVHITFWLWWPFFWAACHTGCFYPDNQVFARVYLQRLMICCGLVVLYLSGIAWLVVTPRIFLLADLESPPSYMCYVPYLSAVLALTFCVLLCIWSAKTMVLDSSDGEGVRLRYRDRKD